MKQMSMFNRLAMTAGITVAPAPTLREGLSVWSTFIPVLILAALVSISGNSHGQPSNSDRIANRNDTSTVRQPSKEFETAWDGIRTCDVKFYSPENGEQTLEAGSIYRYLKSRGYDIRDTGRGYLRADHIDERFHGYRALALTLPDEWGVYGIEIAAELSTVRKKIFPSVRFVRRTQKSGATTLTSDLSSKIASTPAIFLTLEGRRLRNGEYQTVISCRLEDGN